MKQLLLIKNDNVHMDKIELLNVIRVLGKSKVIEILRSLKDGEKSFTDLQFDIRAQISTTQRAVDALTGIGLIEREEAKRGGKRVVIYRLTPLGQEVLRWLDDFDRRTKKLLTVNK